MQFLPSTFIAALGGKVAAKGQKAVAKAGQAVAQNAQAGKTAGTARAAQEVFGNMLGEAKRVQATGASKVAAVAQQATQARAAFAGKAQQVATNGNNSAPVQNFKKATSSKIAQQLGESLNIARPEMANVQAATVVPQVAQQATQAKAAFAGKAQQVATNINNSAPVQNFKKAANGIAQQMGESLNIARPASEGVRAAATSTKMVRKHRAASVQDMLNQAVAVANAPQQAPMAAMAPTMSEAGEAAPKTVTAKVADNKATVSTRAAENLVERVSGKHTTPVATADASAQNIQNVQEAMLEAETEQEAPKVKVANPYTRHTTDGVTYTLQEVSFTRQDLQELRATLVQEGVAPAKIAELDALIEMPDGATLGQVMLRLQGERTPVELEDSEMDAIDTQLSSVDPSGVLATSFLQAVAANNPRGALNMLDKALGELEATEPVEISKSGMMALGKALGMNESALQEMAAQFGDEENATVLPSQFGALLAPIAEKIVADKANQEKLDAALSKTLKPVIAKARQRMEKENQAHSLQDRKVAQSKAQIERSVQEKSRDIIDETLEAAGQEQESENVQRHSAVFAQSDTVVAKPGHHGNEKVRDERSAQAQAAQTQPVENRAAAPQADNTQRQPVSSETAQQSGNTFAQQTNTANTNAGTQQEARQEARQDAGQDTRQNAHSAPEQETVQESAQSTGWQELLNKVDVQPATASVEQVAFTMAQPVAAVVENAPLASTAQPEPLARHLVNQVENGVLRTLRNGATSLELQLHPQELGTLNIVLTSYNGEVSAKIIADKSETVDMLNHQLDTIRASLEEQGVKVEKVDVELRQNDQENSDQYAWQDTDRHNSWQEQDARRQTLTRMRNLANVRNNTTNSETTTLERSVHIMGRTAENAATALDLVA